jgi:hypothetical protein
MRRSLLVCGGVVLAALALACSGSSQQPPMAGGAMANQQLAGIWRMTSYVPQNMLSPALLLSMQADKILVRFEDGRVSSATSALTFDRKYRIADVSGRNFKVFIADEAGVEVENHCQFDESGRVMFQTFTAPWIGRGVLEREGVGMTVGPQPPR